MVSWISRKRILSPRLASFRRESIQTGGSSRESVFRGGVLQRRLTGALASLLTATSLTVGQANEPAIYPPPVTVHGILQSTEGNLAILAGPNQTWVVREGDQLGDYRVSQIADHRVVFNCRNRTFPLAIVSSAHAGAQVSDEGPSNRLAHQTYFQLELAEVDLVFAVKLIAASAHQDFIVAPGADVPNLSLTGTFHTAGALSAVVRGTRFSWTTDHGWLVVADKGSFSAIAMGFDANLGRLEKTLTKPVTLDFVNADFAYVCAVLAKELRLPVLTPPPHGSTTCTSHARLSRETLAIVCAVQLPPVTVSLSDGGLVFQK